MKQLEDVKREIENTRARLQQRQQVPEAEKKRILKERANKTAIKTEPYPEMAGKSVLVFELSREVYALEPSYVREVLKNPVITRLPCCPDHIAGIVNVRGVALPVLDLRILFNLTPVEKTMAYSLIVINEHEKEFCLIADKIKNVSYINEKDLIASPVTFTHAYDVLIAGITPDRIILLDGRQLCTHPSLIVNHGGTF